VFRYAVIGLLAACGGESGESDPEVPDSDTSTEAAPRVLFTTTLGDFTVELDPEAAPLTVANFLAYVDAGFYDGDDNLGATTFHRVVEDFVVQGGGFTEAGAQKAVRSPIVLEDQNGLSNLKGTIAMARTNVADSATSQFYVNLVDNKFLDGTSGQDGYAVFGKVVSGEATIQTLGSVPTNREQPTTPVVITACERE